MRVPHIIWELDEEQESLQTKSDQKGASQIVGQYHHSLSILYRSVPILETYQLQKLISINTMYSTEDERLYLDGCSAVWVALTQTRRQTQYFATSCASPTKNARSEYLTVSTPVVLGPQTLY